MKSGRWASGVQLNPSAGERQADRTRRERHGGSHEVRHANGRWTLPPNSISRTKQEPRGERRAAEAVVSRLLETRRGARGAGRNRIDFEPAWPGICRPVSPGFASTLMTHALLAGRRRPCSFCGLSGLIVISLLGRVSPGQATRALAVAPRLSAVRNHWHSGSTRGPGPGRAVILATRLHTANPSRANVEPVVCLHLGRGQHWISCCDRHGSAVIRRNPPAAVCLVLTQWFFTMLVTGPFARMAPPTTSE